MILLDMLSPYHQVLRWQTLLVSLNYMPLRIPKKRKIYIKVLLIGDGSTQAFIYEYLLYFSLKL